MDANSRLLALAEKVERTTLDLEAYSALIEKYKRKIKEKLNLERARHS